MGMISDMFCSSPASTSTRKSHNQQIRYNSTTPILIRVLSSPCRNSNDVAVNPNKPVRHDYKQLLRRQKSSSSGYGDDSCMEQLRSRRRRSSADASDVKEGYAIIGNNKFDCLLSKLSDAGTRLSRSSVSYDENKQPKREHQQAIANKQVVETSSRCSTSSGSSSSSSSSSSNRLPPISTIARSRSPAAAAAVSPNLKSSPSSRYHDSTDKVVVLWVSLHCKGCEAKVRKHISKMEGVKSFSTDWMSKRVTVISNMDPHDVLASVSTVKYAHFWPSSSSSSSSYYHSPSPSPSSSAALLTLTR